MSSTTESKSTLRHRDQETAAALAILLGGTRITPDDTAMAVKLWRLHADPRFHGLLTGGGFTWNPIKQTYVNKFGGKPVTAKQLKDISLAFSEAVASDVEDDPAKKKKRRALLIGFYLVMAAMAAGGFRRLVRGLIENHRNAPSIENSLGYLGKFEHQIAQGAAGSPAQIAARMRLYWAYGNSLFEEVKRRSHEGAKGYDGKKQKWLERNILGPNENHCRPSEGKPGCVQLTNLGWRPIGTIPPPGTRVCGPNCKCRTEYRAVDPDDPSETIMFSADTHMRHPPMTFLGLEQKLAQARARREASFSEDESGDYVWRMIGAEGPDSEGKKHGGSRALIRKSDGMISKGAEGIVGKTVGELKEKKGKTQSDAPANDPSVSPPEPEKRIHGRKVSVRKNPKTNQWEASIWGNTAADVARDSERLAAMGIHGAHFSSDSPRMTFAMLKDRLAARNQEPLNFASEEGDVHFRNINTTPGDDGKNHGGKTVAISNKTGTIVGGVPPQVASKLNSHITDNRQQRAQKIVDNRQAKPSRWQRMFGKKTAPQAEQPPAPSEPAPQTVEHPPEGFLHRVGKGLSAAGSEAWEGAKNVGSGLDDAFLGTLGTPGEPIEGPLHAAKGIGEALLGAGKIAASPITGIAAAMQDDEPVHPSNSTEIHLQSIGKLLNGRAGAADGVDSSHLSEISKRLNGLQERSPILKQHLANRGVWANFHKGDEVNTYSGRGRAVYDPSSDEKFSTIDLATGAKFSKGGSNLAESPADAFTHELGHHVQRSISKTSDPGNKEWSDIHGEKLPEEWGKSVSSYGGTDPRELFAESFLKHSDPGRFGELPPEISAYFDKHLGKPSSAMPANEPVHHPDHHEHLSARHHGAAAEYEKAAKEHSGHAANAKQIGNDELHAKHTGLADEYLQKMGKHKSLGEEHAEKGKAAAKPEQMMPGGEYTGEDPRTKGYQAQHDAASHHENAGDVYAKHGDHKKAAEHYQQADTHTQVAGSLGTMKRERIKGKLDDANAAMAKGRTAQPETPSPVVPSAPPSPLDALKAKMNPEPQTPEDHEKLGRKHSGLFKKLRAEGKEDEAYANNAKATKHFEAAKAMRAGKTPQSPPAQAAPAKPAAPSGTNPHVTDDQVHEAVKELYGIGTSNLTIQKLREHIAGKYGPEAASHANLDPQLVRLRGSKVRLVSPGFEFDPKVAERREHGIPGLYENFTYIKPHETQEESDARQEKIREHYRQMGDTTPAEYERKQALGRGPVHDDIVHQAVKDLHGASGKDHVTIQQLRQHIADKHGAAAASHENLDPQLKRMRADNKVRMVSHSGAVGHVGYENLQQEIDHGVKGHDEVFTKIAPHAAASPAPSKMDELKSGMSGAAKPTGRSPIDPSSPRDSGVESKNPKVIAAGNKVKSLLDNVNTGKIGTPQIDALMGELKVMPQNELNELLSHMEIVGKPRSKSDAIDKLRQQLINQVQMYVKTRSF